MACFYCWRENRNVPSGGSCVTCNRPICISPPHRVDGVFHGDECQCGCFQLICEPHQSQHVDHHHSGDTSCFPLAGTSICLPILSSAVSLLTGDPPPEVAADASDVGLLNRILNIVSPGHSELYDRFGGRSSALWRLERDEEIEVSYVLFEKDFFATPVVFMVLGVALRHLGASWSVIRTSRLPYRLEIDGERRACLDRFSDWSRGADFPEQRALEPWLPTGHSGYKLREITRGLSDMHVVRSNAEFADGLEEMLSVPREAV